jgi:NAD(P)H-dependent flavin oxidoreductase YrpB (nitropropane dioxygenase family)
MLRSDWTEAWENPDNPTPLGMPLQFMVTGEAVARTSQYSDQSAGVRFNPVGQVVGQLNKVRRTKDVILDMVEEYVDTVERMSTGLQVNA